MASIPGSGPSVSASALSWGDVTGALGRVRESALRATSDTWKGVQTLFGGEVPIGAGTPPDRLRVIDGRFGDPIRQQDGRKSPVIQGPEPHELDQVAGNRENRAGMPDSARAIGFGAVGALALIAGILIFGRR